MIRLIILVAVMVAGVIFGPQLLGNKGYVLIALDNYTIELTVASAVIVLILVFVILLAIKWLFTKLFGLRQQTVGWYGSWRRRKANNQTINATLAMAEGDYKRAEKLMLKGATSSDTPLLNYLGAAKAAQAQGNDLDRDEYLQKAQTLHPGAALPLLLTQAELHIELGEYDRAMSILDSLYPLNPRHPMVLDLRHKVYLARQEWEPLSDLLPTLRKVGKLTEEQEQVLLNKAWSGRLQLAADDGLDNLLTYWQSLPRRQRQNADLLAHYGDMLCQLGADDKAAEIWQRVLRRKPLPQLLVRLPKLKLDDYQPLLATLKRFANDKNLTVDHARAQLHLLSGELEEARELLEREAEQMPTATTYHLLAQIMERQRLTNKANKYYRQALQLAGL